MNEKLKLDTIEIGGKIEVENISINMFDPNHKRVYECEIILNIDMIWNEDININHKSRLRWVLNEDEVKQLKEKGLIRWSNTNTPYSNQKPRK
jgi:hypothetical protein